MKHINQFAILLSLVAVCCATAEIRLPNCVSDNMAWWLHACDNAKEEAANAK